MLEVLDSYDWREAFEYASRVSLVEGAFCSANVFSVEDVVEVLHLDEGENDGPSWIVVGKLSDGRFFYLEAECDYTGWACTHPGSAWVSDNYDNLIQFGVTQNSRDRFGL